MRASTAIARALTLLAALIATGVAGYMLLAGASFLDALYMTVTTLSTVGYREVVPLDRVGQVFTMLLIICGLGIVFYGTSLVAGDVIEGRLRLVLGRRRVQKQIEQLSGHYIVCGYGRMGRIVCKELAAKPVPFVVVERDPTSVRAVQDDGHLYVDGDATEDETLTRVGIARARGLVTALPRDSDNVYVVLSARQMNPALLIVARAEDERSEPKLIQAGATRVVSPYVIGGSRMAGALLRPAVLDVVDLATHYRSMELKIEELPVVANRFPTGATLASAGLCEEGVIVIAIKKASGEMLFNPKSEVLVEAGDRLVIMGQASTLTELERRLGQ